VIQLTTPVQRIDRSRLGWMQSSRQPLTGNVMPQVLVRCNRILMPKQQDLSSDTFVEVHGITIDQNFVRTGSGWNDGHVRENYYLLTSICSVHIRSYLFKERIGESFFQVILILLIIAMIIPLTLIQKPSDWLFYFLFIVLPFGCIFYIISFVKWFFVEIGTPAGKVILTRFINWIPFE
jgi:hypothetical protein